MTRGNQRDNDRAKALKKAGNSKNKNTQTGSEFARSKDDAAAIMREKQRKGMYPQCARCTIYVMRLVY
ncbi:unnamed protein product [Penicillium viridicatum]